MSSKFLICSSVTMWSSAGDAKLSRLHEVNQLMYVKQCSRVISQRQAFLIFSLRNLRAEGREPLKHSACLEYTRKNLNTLNMPPLNFESDKSLSEISLHRSTGNIFFSCFPFAPSWEAKKRNENFPRTTEQWRRIWEKLFLFNLFWNMIPPF